MRFKKHRKKSDMPKKVVNVLTFVVVLLIFIVVLGGIALWVYLTVNKEAPKDPSNSELLSSSKFTSEDNRNILFVLTDNNTSQDKKTVYGFLVFGINPEKEQIFITSLPVETMVDEPLEQVPLNSLYLSKGSSEAKAALEKLLKSPIHNIVEMTIGGVEKIIKYYSEGIVFDVPEPLDFKGSPPIKMSAGKQTLSSSQVGDLLRYPAESWSGGSEQKAIVFAGAMKSFTEKYFTVSRFEQVDTDYGKVINMVKSDINIAQFHALKPSLEFLVKSKNVKLEVLTPVLDVSGSGGDQKFYLDDDFLKKYMKLYGAL